MKIVAIGGGEIGRPGYPVETTKIDQEIISLTGKKSPKLLFLGTASDDSTLYVETIKKHFGKRLNCQISVLNLIIDKPNKKVIEERVLNTDIIYVGGGNTLRMLKIWRKYGLDKILEQAGKKGVVLSGLSAGANCWFKFASSDSLKLSKGIQSKKSSPLIKLKGLNFINLTVCPHYLVEADRKTHFKSLMRKTPGVGIGIDNCAALEIVDDKFKIISSKKGSNAYKVYWKKGQYFEEEIKQTQKLQSLSELQS